MPFHHHPSPGQGRQGQPVRRPPVLPSPLVHMTPPEALDYLDQVTTRLKRKQQREQAYLDRRAQRGVFTPTDEAYEQDQQLEAELLFLIDQLRLFIKAGGL